MWDALTGAQGQARGARSKSSMIGTLAPSLGKQRAPVIGGGTRIQVTGRTHSTYVMDDGKVTPGRGIRLAEPSRKANPLTSISSDFRRKLLEEAGRGAG